MCIYIYIYIYIHIHAIAGSGTDLLLPKFKPFELIHLVSSSYYRL